MTPTPASSLGVRDAAGVTPAADQSRGSMEWLGSALERDRRAAREAAADGKILCSSCGCQTSPLEELCWNCEQPPGLGDGLIEPPYARLYELSVEALRERRER